LHIGEKVSEKKKIFVIADHPLTPSGVGTQTKYVIEALLKTGRYKIICFGGAIQHPDYKPTKTEQWGDDWIIHPVDGYGNQDMVRSVLRMERPDMLWFMTDPRFWPWLWAIDNEIRTHIPMVYYHVWDNKPYPFFNKKYYDSNDHIVTISKITDDIVKTVAPNVPSTYLPHAVDGRIFYKLSKAEIAKAKEESKLPKDKCIFFWNNRNARRKQSGTLIYWFKDFLDQIGHDKAMLIMHTEPTDPNGQDLNAIIHHLGLGGGQVMISNHKVPPQNLNVIYNMIDCTINISDAEGFGLATLESLSTETPIVVNMTGGLQEQVTDGKNWFGVGIEPAAKAIIGSQEVPYIYEDRLNKDDFINALLKIYNMKDEERKKLGAMGKKYVEKNYNFNDFEDRWVKLIDRIVEKHGSWETRKVYKPYSFTEIR
jgi:glycosyltransferase involved in cell wall biosynthesis